MTRVWPADDAEPGGTMVTRESGCERRSQARHFCNLAFPGLRECFLVWELPLTGRKDSFIHGKAASESEFGQENSVTRNTGDSLQNRKGSTEGTLGYLPLPLMHFSP